MTIAPLNSSSRSLHLAVLCPEVTGHLNPFLTLMHELRQRGHRLTFVGKLDAQGRVAAAGFDFVPLGEAEFPEGSWRKSFQLVGEQSGLKALRTTVVNYLETTAVMLREAPDRMRELQPDGLLVDQTLTPGATIAELLDLPFVTICAALPINESVHRPPAVVGWRYRPSWWGRLRNRVGNAGFRLVSNSIKSAINRFRVSSGLAPQQSIRETFSPLAQIAQIPREFDFPFPDLPQNFHYVGPLHAPQARPAVAFPFERLTGRPLIYASLGTIQNRVRQMFRIIADACNGLDAQLVLSRGGGGIDDFGGASGDAIVVDYAPQLELLQRATVTITHAGMNTTAESLAQGVPLVAIPITNDQPGVAARIEWTGTGKMLPVSRLSVPRLRQAVSELLQDAGFRERAAAMRAAMLQAGGVPRAADIVETAISTGRPVSAEDPCGGCGDATVEVPVAG